MAFPFSVLDFQIAALPCLVGSCLSWDTSRCHRLFQLSNLGSSTSLSNIFPFVVFTTTPNSHAYSNICFEYFCFLFTFLCGIILEPCWFLSPVNLWLCLTHNRCSINICSLNKWRWPLIIILHGSQGGWENPIKGSWSERSVMLAYVWEAEFLCLGLSEQVSEPLEVWLTQWQQTSVHTVKKETDVWKAQAFASYMLMFACTIFFKEIHISDLFGNHAEVPGLGCLLWSLENVLPPCGM